MGEVKVQGQIIVSNILWLISLLFRDILPSHSWYGYFKIWPWTYKIKAYLPISNLRNVQKKINLIDLFFLHTKLWILGGKKSIFTAVIHLWRSPFPQFARARTIDEYDVTMPAPRVHVTSQINCGDVTMPSQKRPSLATMAKPAINNCFSEIVCSGHLVKNFD